MSISGSNQYSNNERIRHLYHKVNQPLTTILLLSEMGGASGKGLNQTEAQEIYQAGLICREMLLELQELFHRATLENAGEPEKAAS